MYKLPGATGVALFVLVLSTSGFARDPASPGSSSPAAGFFIGLGGSLNHAREKQDIGGYATSEVYDGTTLTATGQAGGPPATFRDSEWTLAPAAQLGYFSHFDNSSWLWGAKVTYQYLNTDLAVDRALVPQVGSFTTTGANPVTTPFVGNVVIGQARNTVDHELHFMAFVGRSFSNVHVYLGAGPALFGTSSYIKNAIGFANVSGMPTDVTGAPVSFSKSKWVWGGAVQIGLTYFFSPAWSFDINYTFARSAKYDVNYSAGFSNPRNGTTGFAHLDTTQRITSQSVVATINFNF